MSAGSAAVMPAPSTSHDSETRQAPPPSQPGPETHGCDTLHQKSVHVATLIPSEVGASETPSASVSYGARGTGLGRSRAGCGTRAGLEVGGGADAEAGGLLVE